MTIVFESQLYPQSLEHVFVKNSKVTLDYAAHNFSKAINDGLEQNQVNVLLLNTPNLGSFPCLYKKIWVKGGKLEKGTSVGYCNIAAIKRISIKHAIRRELGRLLQRIGKGEQVVLLIYNFRCVQLLKDLKQQYKGLKVCMIVTDLPEYMVNPYRKLFGRLPFNIVKNKNADDYDLDYVDGFVFLAPKMVEKLRICGKPWVQMEGIYESNTVVGDVEKSQYKTILYTGNLSKRYGIIELLDAFDAIEMPDYRLWIRGSGDCEDIIKERISKDERIKLFPPLSREELIRLQRQATVLINPVSSYQEFTSYFFPSKTLEYLASGTPVIMSHLSCMPPEYDQYIYYLEDESVEGLKNKIIEVCSKPQEELDSFGEAASQFVYRNKTNKSQMKKIIDFINTL